MMDEDEDDDEEGWLMMKMLKETTLSQAQQAQAQTVSAMDIVVQ